MDAIFDQIRALAKDADEASRKKLLDGLNDLYYSIESPNDSLNRIISSVSLEELELGQRFIGNRPADLQLPELAWI